MPKHFSIFQVQSPFKMLKKRPSEPTMHNNNLLAQLQQQYQQQQQQQQHHLGQNSIQVKQMNRAASFSDFSNKGTGDG